MNKIFIKYGFPLSLIFIMLCLAFNKDVAFLVQWNTQYGLNIDPKACYYISLIYLSIVTCITSYYFYLKMEEAPNEEQLHAGYFTLSFLLGLPVVCIAILGPFAHGMIALTILASAAWCFVKLYHVVMEFYRT